MFFCVDSPEDSWGWQGQRWKELMLPLQISKVSAKEGALSQVAGFRIEGRREEIDYGASLGGLDSYRAALVQSHGKYSLRNRT